MSTISSFIYINPIEPAPLSLRIPSGLETRLDITFYDQLGTVYSSDIAAQIELTPRTNGGPPIYYQVPAIDTVNGKARAFFPMNTLLDRNGYRLNLYGTVRGEPLLIAKGVVDVIETPGTMTMPVDAIDTIDLTFERGEDVALNVKLWTDAGKGVPLDLTAAGASVSANIYTGRGGSSLMPFAVTVIASNEVELMLTIDQVNALPDSCWWTMIASTGAGLITLCEGTVTVTGVATPALQETVVSYNYQKPGEGDVNPISGQIIHNTITQNILKVSKLTQPGADLTATLVLVRADDEILLGATTWVVKEATEESGWFEFVVTPIAQDAVTGTTFVTFRRPVA